MDWYGFVSRRKWPIGFTVALVIAILSLCGYRMFLNLVTQKKVDFLLDLKSHDWQSVEFKCPRSGHYEVVLQVEKHQRFADLNRLIGLTITNENQFASASVALPKEDLTNSSYKPLDFDFKSVRIHGTSDSADMKVITMLGAGAWTNDYIQRILATAELETGDRIRAQIQLKGDWDLLAPAKPKVCIVRWAPYEGLGEIFLGIMLISVLIILSISSWLIVIVKDFRNAKRAK